MLFALAVGLACAKEVDRTPRAESAVAGATSAPAVVAVGATREACPATGLWSACAILERLDRAGLAPRADTAAATEPPLAQHGALVRLGRSELELYVYPDAASREQDQRKLDRKKYLLSDAPSGMEAQPTIISSANLIAILHSRNDHQRERVSDAIAAGPPQPLKP